MEKNKKLLAEAKEISEQTGSPIVYCNDNEVPEWFTTKNLALLSVGGKESKLETFDFTAKEKEEAPVKYKVTKEDLEKFPQLVEAKIKLGKELDFNPNEISADKFALLLDKK